MNHAAEAKEYGEKSLEAATEAADELWQLNASVLIAQSHGQQSASSTVFLYTSSCCRQHVARINIAMLHKFAVYREPFPHLDQTWQAQFPSCCAGNMELSNATSPFTNHQPRSVPDWTQIPPVHECLLMTLIPRPIEEWTNLLTYLLTCYEILTHITESQKICQRKNVCDINNIRSRVVEIHVIAATMIPALYSLLRCDRCRIVTSKPGFHYPSWRPELTARVDGFHYPSTRAVNSGVILSVCTIKPKRLKLKSSNMAQG